MDRTFTENLFQVNKTEEIKFTNIKFNENILESIDEININDQEVVSKWIDRIIYYTKTCYYKSDFTKLTRFFNCKIPQFLHKNQNILYTIMKYILFDKIRMGEIEESTKFYKDYFIYLLKKTHITCWDIKNNHFQTILSNPSSLRNYDYIIKSELNFLKFIIILERDLKKFVDLKINCINNNNEENGCFENKNYENFDELEGEIIHLINSKSNDSNNYENNIKVNPIKDKSSNLFANNCRKEYIPKYQKEIAIKDKIPLIKNFNPQYTKRANLDKIFLRKFKKYLKNKKECIKNTFWVHFIEGNFIPPFKNYDVDIKNEVEFKSFNISYLMYIFNKENAFRLFEEFLNDSGKETLDNLIRDYNLNKQNEEIEQLKFYLYNLHEVFSNLKNNINSSENTNKDIETINTTNSKDELNSISSVNLNSLMNINLNNNKNVEINNMEAPLNPLSYEKVYEKYLGQDFELENNLKNNTNKKDLFQMININTYKQNRKINCRNKKKKYLNKNDSDSDKSLERSRELDYNLFDYFKKYWSESSSSEKEE